MIVNPINVINLLLVTFQSLKIEETPVNHKEIELKEQIGSILLASMNEFNGVEMMVEESLDFQEPYKDTNVQIIEDNVMHTLPDEPVPPTTECTKDEEELSYEYKLRAVEYWRSGKKNLSFDTVRQKFKRVKSVRQLRRWAHTLNKGGTYREKIARICDFTLQNFKAAVEAGFIVHDNDLRKWALQAQKEIGNEDFRFSASKHWLLRFKHAHRIVSRKINKFITRKTLEDAKQLRMSADKFVADVKQEIGKIGIENVYNSDQSGIQLEMHSGRTLAIEGEKQVECLVQSVSSTTHSYTIQPLISAEGKLLSPLFLVLKEESGKFGPIVEKNLFRPANVYIEASKSGKLTSGMNVKLFVSNFIKYFHWKRIFMKSYFFFLILSDHFKIWLKNIYFPNVGKRSMLLIDSWSGHCPTIITETTPHDKNINLKLIPVGTTGKIQPLDVYGFRVWKNFVRHFSDNAILMQYDINLHLRNNIIKLQSLVHNQLSSPRYINLFKYAWYKSGYIDEKPGEFENPVEFSFGDSCKTHCEVEGCMNVAVIRCSWCKKSLCFKHFFDDNHYCTRFEY